MGENLAISITIYSGLGALIAIGVVYNAARIQLSERAHELASLRILGFSRGEVSFVLLGELLGLALLAIPLRLPARLRLRRLDRLGFLDRHPHDPAGGPTADLRLCRACRRRGGAGLGPVVRRRIDRLDLVAVMKMRE